MTDAHIVESDAMERFHALADSGDGLEELESFFDGHVENVGDGLFSECDFESFAIVSFSSACVALDVDVGEEMHFDTENAVALAGFATPAFDIEGESPGLVSARA